VVWGRSVQGGTNGFNAISAENHRKMACKTVSSSLNFDIAKSYFNKDNYEATKEVSL